MAAKKKSSFYHARKNICPNNERAAELLGVNVEEILRMDKEGAPVVMERFLLLWDNKRISEPGWEGWCFSRGALMYKKSRWMPDNLLAARREAEMIDSLQHEVFRLYSVKGVYSIIRTLIRHKLHRKTRIPSRRLRTEKVNPIFHGKWG